MTEQPKPSAPVTPPAPAPQATSQVPSGTQAGAGNQLEDPALWERVRRIAESETRKHLDPVIKQQRALQEKTSAFDSVFGAMKSSGLIKDDVNVDQIRAQFVAQEQAKLLSTPPTQPPAEPEPTGSFSPQPAPVDPIAAEVQALASRYGLPVAVKPGEQPPPEWGLLVQNQGIKAYLDSVELAGKAYQARTGSQPTEPPPTPTPLDMGGGAGAARNPIENISDPDELLGLWLSGKGQGRR